MKKRKLPLLTICFIFLVTFSVFTQEKLPQYRPSSDIEGSCSCSNSQAGCSTSVTCPTGNAFCSCGPGGCFSSCSSNSFLLDFPDVALVSQKLAGLNDSSVSELLSKFYNKKINFASYKNEFKFSLDKQPDTNWDIFENLSQNGELKINGIPYSVWKGVHEITLGNKVSFCTGNIAIGSFINELSFVTGVRYTIVEGDAAQRITTQFKDVTLVGLVEILKKNYQVTIEKK